MTTYYEEIQNKIISEITSCNWNEIDQDDTDFDLLPQVEIKVMHTLDAPPQQHPHILLVGGSRLPSVLLFCHFVSNTALFKKMAVDNYGYTLYYSQAERCFVLLQSLDAHSPAIPEDSTFSWSEKWLLYLSSLSVFAPDDLSAFFLLSAPHSTFPSLSPSSCEKRIRYLQTQAAKSLDLIHSSPSSSSSSSTSTTSSSSSSRFLPLEAGLYLSGHAASFISHFEVNKLPAVLFLAVYPTGAADLTHLSFLASSILPLLQSFSSSKQFPPIKPSISYRTWIQEGEFLNPDLYQ